MTLRMVLDDLGIAAAVVLGQGHHVVKGQIGLGTIGDRLQELLIEDRLVGDRLLQQGRDDQPLPLLTPVVPLWIVVTHPAELQGIATVEVVGPPLLEVNPLIIEGQW